MYVFSYLPKSSFKNYLLAPGNKANDILEILRVPICWLYVFVPLNLFC